MKKTFEVGARVRRNPRVWKNDTTVYIVRGFSTAFDGTPLVMIEKVGKRGAGVGYLARELVQA